LSGKPPLGPGVSESDQTRVPGIERRSNKRALSLAPNFKNSKNALVTKEKNPETESGTRSFSMVKKTKK
jgi:hypothetical protein